MFGADLVQDVTLFWGWMQTRTHVIVHGVKLDQDVTLFGSDLDQG